MTLAAKQSVNMVNDFVAQKWGLLENPKATFG